MQVGRLLAAAAAGDVAALEAAAAELDPNAPPGPTVAGVRDGNRRSALHFAALRGRAAMVEHLVGVLGLGVDEADAEARRRCC